MRISARVYVPAPIEAVFDFLDDPINTLRLGGHAADHVARIVVVSEEAGRRTFDLNLQAGPKTWTQTVRQVVRDRPTRLDTDGWTWVNDRNDPYLHVATERTLTAEADGTLVSTSVTYTPRKRLLFAKLVGWLQRGQTQLELEHQLHILAEHFAARDIART
jgi:hypothetical protein